MTTREPARACPPSAARPPRGSASFCVFSTGGWGRARRRIRSSAFSVGPLSSGCTQVGSDGGARGWGWNPYGQLSGRPTFTPPQVRGSCPRPPFSAWGRPREAPSLCGSVCVLEGSAYSPRALRRPFLSLPASEFQQSSLIPHFGPSRLLSEKQPFWKSVFVDYVVPNNFTL